MDLLDLNKIPWSPSPNYHPRDHWTPSKITHIVIHTTQGNWPGCVSWLCKKGSNVSAHYVISKKGEIVQLVTNDMGAFHVGNANGFTLGIEHEGFVKNPEWVTSELWEASTKLVATLSQIYKISVENIIGHNDPLMKKFKNDHSDPGEFWDMKKYRNRIQELLNEGKA